MVTAKQAAATIMLCVRTMRNYHFSESRSPHARALMLAEVQLQAAWLAGLTPEMQRDIFARVEAELIAQCGDEAGVEMAADFAKAVAAAGPPT